MQGAPPERSQERALSDKPERACEGCWSEAFRPLACPAPALSEQNSKYLERPSNRSDRPGKMQENQWPRAGGWCARRRPAEREPSSRRRSIGLWCVIGAPVFHRLLPAWVIYRVEIFSFLVCQLDIWIAWCICAAALRNETIYICLGTNTLTPVKYARTRVLNCACRQVFCVHTRRQRD